MAIGATVCTYRSVSETSESTQAATTGGAGRKASTSSTEAADYRRQPATHAGRLAQPFVFGPFVGEGYSRLVRDAFPTPSITVVCATTCSAAWSATFAPTAIEAPYCAGQDSCGDG